MVKANQEKVAKYASKDPVLNDKYKKLNAEMTNTGAAAQRFAKILTSGIDQTAFPVKQMVDE